MQQQTTFNTTTRSYHIILHGVKVSKLCRLLSHVGEYFVINGQGVSGSPGGRLGGSLCVCVGGGALVTARWRR